jgi:hypothetical protein
MRHREVLSNIDQKTTEKQFQLIELQLQPAVDLIDRWSGPAGAQIEIFKWGWYIYVDILTL